MYSAMPAEKKNQFMLTNTIHYFGGQKYFITHRREATAPFTLDGLSVISNITDEAVYMLVGS